MTLQVRCKAGVLPGRRLYFFADADSSPTSEIRRKADKCINVSRGLTLTLAVLGMRLRSDAPVFRSACPSSLRPRRESPLLNGTTAQISSQPSPSTASARFGLSAATDFLLGDEETARSIMSALRVPEYCCLKSAK